MAVEKATVFRVNDLVFIPDDEEGFIPASVVTEFSQGKEGKVSLTLENNSEKTLTKAESKRVERMDAQSYKHLPDMISIKMLNEAALLYNLKLRYFEPKGMIIYTNIGAILVAINPFTDLGLYTSEMEDKYLNAGPLLPDMPPHIFKVAEAAMNNLRTQDRDQSAVITGESGAGKTETTKRFLQYISEKSRRNREAYGGDFGVDTEKLRQQILDSNPFMEAFGNAKTLRNDNSSRFGKLIEMSFEAAKGVVVGCTITNYLLEKSRVVKVGEGERNYHIFYQLCFAAQTTHADLKKKYHLQSADMFNYCLGDNPDLESLKIEGESDAQIFEETKTAMEKLNMKPEEIDITFKICSALLHIGNIEFQGEAKDLAEFNPGVAETALVFGAELLGVDADSLGKAILERKLIGKTIKQHTKQEAESARDALSKFVYEKMFDWLILKMNEAMAQKTAKKARGARALAVLDIFGFETFKINSFEQLCINYCNEQLQSFFNLHVFKKEQLEYLAEGINVAKIGFYDNDGVIEAIGTGRTAVMVICDDTCGFEGSTDQSFLNKVKNVAKQRNDKEAHKYFLFTPKVQDIRKNDHYKNAFVIKHFAGFVHYNVENFLEKNKDILRKDIRICLAGSSEKLVSGLFPGGGDANAGKQGKFKNTLGKKFKGSLTKLMKRLNETTPQFVRCIKPNREKKPDIFTAEKVFKQLNEAGLLEVCKIRKLGYPIKKSHKEFLGDYLCIAKSAKNVEDLCDLMMKKEILFETNKSPNWQVGKTKVFMRSEQLYILEKERSEALKEVLAILHNFARKWLFRSKAKAALVALKKIRTGIDEKNPEILQEGLNFYEEKGPGFSNLPVVLQGKEAMKELRVKYEVIQDLKKAIEEADVATVKVKLELANQLGMKDHPVVRDAANLIEELVVKKEVNRKLQEAVGAQEEKKLKSAIDYAVDKGYGDNKLCKQAEKMLSTLKERNTRLDLLKSELDKSNPDLDELAKLVKELRKYGCSDEHPLILAAAEKGNLVLEKKRQQEEQISTLEKQLRKNINAGNFHKLQELVAAAVQLQYNGDLVKQASDMIQNLQQRQELLDEVGNASRVLAEKSKLPNGITESDLIPLKHAIKVATDVVGLDLDQEIQVIEGNRLYERMEEQLQVQDELALVLKEDSPTAMYKMLEKIQSLGLQTRDADALVQKVRETELLKAKADALTNSAEVKEIITNLVTPTPAQRLAHLRERVVIMYNKEYKKLSEEVWQSKDFIISNYYKVRSDADFVSKERPENKKERKSMKHIYEENYPISKSLLELDDHQDTKAVQISSTIAKICDGLTGNKKETVEAATIFIVNNGIADPLLADEIFIQLAKHLTANLNPLSKTKGWHLLCLCSTYFAPTRRFLPYFITFLNHSISDPGLEGNYARYVTSQISASLEFDPRDVNFQPTRKEVKAFFERPPVLMQLALINREKIDVPVPPDYTLADAAKIIRKRTKIMIDLQNPEWSIYIKAGQAPAKLSWKVRLENFYRYYKPENLGNVDQILAYYKGHEENLFKELTSTPNYGPEPTHKKTAAIKRGKGKSKNKKDGTNDTDIDDVLEEEEDAKSSFSIGSKSSIGSAISKVSSVVSGFFKRARGYTNVNIEDVDLPSPKIAWPLPWNSYIGDVANSFYEQDLVPVLTYKRRLCKDKGKPDENLFLQLRKDFLDGVLLPTAQTDVAYLTVTVLALKLMRKNVAVPYGETNKLLKAGLHNCIPKTLKREHKKNDDWLNAFFEVASDQSLLLDKKSKRELENDFFQRVISLPGYGMSYFFAQELKNNAKAYIAKAQTAADEGAVKIGINQRTVTFFKNNEVTHDFALDDITKYFIDGSTITLKVRRTKKKEGVLLKPKARKKKPQKKKSKRKSLRVKIGEKMKAAVNGFVGPRTDTVQLYTLQPQEMEDLLNFFKSLGDNEEE